METKSAHSAPPALLDVDDVSGLLKCSTRTVRRMADSGAMPRPIKLNALLRWRHDELMKWIEAGCPSCRTVKAGAR